MSAEKYAAYRKSRQTLIDYLLLKVAAEDWRAVSDAANDLRVMDAAYEVDSRILQL